MPTNGQFTDLSTLPASDINTLLSRGYRNRIINGAFVINQRAYVSGTALGTGVYCLDRWRSGATNTALTFTAGVQATQVTISSGGVLQQIIERENMPAGTYTLSWTGTATGRINNVGSTPSAYAASPIIVTLNGSANVAVEFTAAGGTRTLGTVQLEAGNVFSPFEYRHRGEELALCHRYFRKDEYHITTDTPLVLGGFYATSQFYGVVDLGVPMRAAPTLSANSGTYGVYAQAAQHPVASIDLYRAGLQIVSIRCTTTTSPAQFAPGWLVVNTPGAGLMYNAEL